MPEMLKKRMKCAKLSVENGWAACPICGNRHLVRILPTTALTDAVLYCKKCKQELLVNIEPSASA